MKRQIWTLLGLLSSLCVVAAAQVPGKIDARAGQLLRAACQFLADTPSFSLTAEVWREHIGDSGEKLQFTRQVDMEVKRPGHLHMEIKSGYTDRGFWFDGKNLNILDRKRNLFSSTAFPGNIDSMLDAAHDRFGIDLPLADLALSNPYENAVAQVSSGRYLGHSTAMGFACHHLAFVQENIDWQVWIDEGPRPLIRKFVITHKDQPGAPEFTGLIRGWNLLDRISDIAFEFEPPAGAMKVELLPDRPNSSLGPASNPTPTPTGR
jgi:hypothetical protein